MLDEVNNLEVNLNYKMYIEMDLPNMKNYLNNLMECNSFNTKYILIYSIIYN